jgi:hypothetical protein
MRLDIIIDGVEHSGGRLADWPPAGACLIATQARSIRPLYLLSLPGFDVHRGRAHHGVGARIDRHTVTGAIAVPLQRFT